MSLFSPVAPATQSQPTQVDHAAYASAVIAAIGAQAAFDADPNPTNLEAKRDADRALRQIRDARQRAAARNAGLR